MMKFNTRTPPARRGARLAMAAAGAAIVLGTAFTAHADTCRQRNFVDRLNLELSVTGGLVQGPGGVFRSRAIRATSSNGETYDTIAGTGFSARIGIDLCYPGALDGIQVLFGACTGHRGVCRQTPSMYSEFPSARDFHKTREFVFAVPRDSDAGKRILESCNAVAGRARGAQEDVALGAIRTTVTLAVDTRRDTGAIGTWELKEGCFGCENLEEYSKTRSFDVDLPLACAPLPQQIKAPPTITDAAIGVSTSGSTCPKPATADVMITAAAPRAVRYRIERGNGTTATPGWIEGRIRKQKNLTGGESAFLRAEHNLDPLDPGTRKFRLRIDGWGTTPWRTVDVQCPPFKVTSAWLKYEVEKGPACPKKVAETATFKSTRPGRAPFKIKTQGGLVVHSGRAEFERDGNEYVARIRRPNLSMNAFDADMMAEIDNQPDANSGWTRLKVECRYKPSGAAGTTDLAPAPGLPDDPPPPGQTLEGEFSFVDTGGTKCPRQGRALINFVTSQQANVHYSLDCTHGSFSGVAKAVPRPQGGFVAPALVTFDVGKTTQANCALKTVAPGKPRVHALKGHLFQCVKPAGISGTGDLAPPSRPNPAPVGSGKAVEPRRAADPPKPADPAVKAKTAAPLQVKKPAAKSKPSIKVAPKIKCVGGTVRRGECDCPDGKVLKKGVCTAPSRKR